MFDKILIANRGAIACRILAHPSPSGNRLGRRLFRRRSLLTHVRLADRGHRARRLHCYLTVISVRTSCSKLLVRRARRAIHPGYGFLSENAAFAEACEANGIAFIGR